MYREVVNPKLRKDRDALSRLGLDSEALLTHGMDKLIYAVPLIENLRDYLLGLDQTPRWLFSRRNAKASSEAIAKWWMDRWLRKRIERDDVLAEVARHDLVRPIRHGARVQLPEMGEDQLFA